MPQAGRYRHRVTIQEPVYTKDASHAPQKTWDDVATVWASVWPLRGREFYAAKSVNSEVETTIRMRYHSDVRNDWRIVHGNNTYVILAVLNLQGRNIELELMCKEVEHDG